MRVTILTMSILISGCSMLDRLELRSARTYGPSLIYLDGELPMTLPRGADRDRYACIAGALYCESFGGSWECRCP